jgi:quercetin dioxygenase-like cupin family protein
MTSRLKEKKRLLTIDEIGGYVSKKSEVYTVKDNTTLNNLVLSSTLLNPRQSTSGHKHPGQEEVYQFVSGSGILQIDEVFHVVKPGNVVLIKDGEFHKVINDTDDPMYFVCVFNGVRSH